MDLGAGWEMGKVVVGWGEFLCEVEQGLSLLRDDRTVFLGGRWIWGVGSGRKGGVGYVMSFAPWWYMRDLSRKNENQKQTTHRGISVHRSLQSGSKYTVDMLHQIPERKENTGRSNPLAQPPISPIANI